MYSQGFRINLISKVYQSVCFLLSFLVDNHRRNRKLLTLVAVSRGGRVGWLLDLLFLFFFLFLTAKNKTYSALKMLPLKKEMHSFVLFVLAAKCWIMHLI